MYLLINIKIIKAFHTIQISKTNTLKGFLCKKFQSNELHFKKEQSYSMFQLNSTDLLVLLSDQEEIHDQLFSL